MLELSNVSKKLCSNYETQARIAARDMFSFGKRDKLRPDEFWAVKNISFSLSVGEKGALFGPQDSGKSVLTALCGGLLQADTGTVHRRGACVYMNSLTAGFKPMLTTWENCIFKLRLFHAKNPGRLCREVLSFAGLEKQAGAFLNDLDGVSVRRLGLAILVHLDADLYVLDGVIPAAPDDYGLLCLDQLETRLKNKTALIVSGNDLFLDRLGAQVLALSGGKLVYSGKKTEDVFFYNTLESRAIPSAARLSKAEAEDEDDDVEVSPEEEARPDPKNPAHGRLRGKLSKVVINGREHDYERLCLWISPGSSLDLSLEFFPYETFESEEISLRLHAPFQNYPLAVHCFSADGLSGDAGTKNLSFKEGAACCFSFSVRPPALQKGVFGLVLALGKRGTPLSKKDIYKIARFGLETSEPRGFSTVLEVESASFSPEGTVA